MKDEANKDKRWWRTEGSIEAGGSLIRDGRTERTLEEVEHLLTIPEIFSIKITKICIEKERKRIIPCIKVGHYFSKIKDKWEEVLVLYCKVRKKGGVKYLIWDGLRWWKSKRLPIYGKKDWKLYQWR